MLNLEGLGGSIMFRQGLCKRLSLRFMAKEEGESQEEELQDS